MNKLIHLFFVVISIISSLSNAQPADMDPAKLAANVTAGATNALSKALNATKNPAGLAANVTAGATNALSKALNATKNIIPINPADIATKGAGMAPAVIAACMNFVSQITGLLNLTSAAKLPGMDVASQLTKTGGELLTKPIEVGQVVVKDVLKVFSPPSVSPVKAPTATKDATDAKPDIENVIGSMFKSFGLF